MWLHGSYGLHLASAAQKLSAVVRGAYKAFSRWAAAGVFEAMHDRLCQQWSVRVGRTPEPSAAIIDAQSTRSTAKAA